VPDFPCDAEKSPLAKNTLRERLLARRRSLTAAVRASAAVAVQAATTDLVRTQHPSTTAAYVPVGSEPGGPDLPEVLAAHLPPGGRLLLPVLLPDHDLDWAVYQGPQSLAPGPRGLREPVGPRVGVEAIRHAEVIIVPALAVDRSGLRMGRGGGSYDRVLARITVGRTVALLHDGELLAAVPAEPHDRTVDAVITPREGLTAIRGTGSPQAKP
jgi:5-formyltetrahydrofolate cyclo-ligase